MLPLTVLALSLGLLVGLLRRGSLWRLGALPVRLWWLAAVAWLIQVVLFLSPLSGSLDAWAAPIHLGTVALLGGVILANRRLPGLVLLGVGLALNAAVFAANGGFMPVAESALAGLGRHESIDAFKAQGRVQKTFLMGADTPLWLLGDVLPVPVLNKVYSPGDMVAALGMFWLVVQGMGRTPGASTPREMRDVRPPA